MPRFVSVSDLRGGVRLVTDAAVGVTDIVEAMHATISRPVGRPTRARGIARWIYRIVRGMTRRVGRGLDRTLAVADRSAATTRAPAQEAVVAALNGAFGDHLAAEDNPLATSMHLRYDGEVVDLAALPRTVSEPSATLLVQIHGICMHDGQWGRAGSDPGAVWAAALGATRLAIRYNSGRHISESGRDAADLLTALLAAWPRPVERLVVVGHSMGGLVARSAFSFLAATDRPWPEDTAIVMLGSPHHGAPLERLGSLVDTALSATRYAGPLAALGQARSAGVTDLRFGTVHDADWTGRDRFERGADTRTPVPLPPDAACYVAAATLGDGRGGTRDQSLGDGLVPLDSALGRHADPARDLGVPTERQWVLAGASHFDLLHRPEVTAQVLAWLMRGDS